MPKHFTSGKTHQKQWTLSCGCLVPRYGCLVHRTEHLPTCITLKKKNKYCEKCFTYHADNCKNAFVLPTKKKRIERCLQCGKPHEGFCKGRLLKCDVCGGIHLTLLCSQMCTCGVGL